MIKAKIESWQERVAQKYGLEYDPEAGFLDREKLADRLLARQPVLGDYEKCGYFAAGLLADRIIQDMKALEFFDKHPRARRRSLRH